MSRFIWARFMTGGSIVIFKEKYAGPAHRVQRWLDCEYQGESIPLSQKHLGIITAVTEQQEEQIIIIFRWGLSSSSPTC